MKNCGNIAQSSFDEEYYIDNHSIEEEAIVSIGRYIITWREFEAQFFHKSISISRLKTFSKRVWKKLTGNEKTVLEEKCLSFRKESYTLFTSATNIGEKTIKHLKQYFDPMSHEEWISEEDWEMALNFLKFDKRNDFTQKPFDENDFWGCMLLAYRYRNNLLHGIKYFYLINEQIGVFQKITDIVNVLLMIDVEREKKGETRIL